MAACLDLPSFTRTSSFVALRGLILPFSCMCCATSAAAPCSDSQHGCQPRPLACRQIAQSVGVLPVHAHAAQSGRTPNADVQVGAACSHPRAALLGPVVLRPQAPLCTTWPLHQLQSRKTVCRY